MISPIKVAVGIVFNSQGQILVAYRQAHQDQGNQWEFPGGKIEPGESVERALKRELQEEVGIHVLVHAPWIEFLHDYKEKSVLLHVHQVTEFAGEAQGLEGQSIQWCFPLQLKTLCYLPANEKIVEALNNKFN